MKDLYKRLDLMGYTLTLSEEAKDFVADKGYDPQYGARPLHRAIQKYLEDPLAEFILQQNPEEGAQLEAVLTEDKEGVQIVLVNKVESSDIQEK